MSSINKENKTVLNQAETELMKELAEHVGKISYDILEDFILNTPSVYRPIVGHCFETWFSNLMASVDVKTEPVGGDDVVDMKLNKKTLQLKTPYKNGTKEGEKVAICLHKTHGLEKRPHNLYKPEDFADLLVAKHPNGSLIICPRNKIPLNKDYPDRQWPDYLADPAYFKWENEWINRWDLLEIKQKIDLSKFKHIENRLFKKLGKIVCLSDEDIIKTILMPENFRVLQQNLKGAIREWHFLQAAKKESIKITEPDKSFKTRTRIKVDFISQNGKKLQVKGRTRSISNGTKIGVEVKGSHGRIPQRLYKRGDFDFLVVVLDPDAIPDSFNSNSLKRGEYNFCIIPANNLPSHERSKEWGEEYLKDIFFFELGDYPFNDFSLLKD
ncbi:MAG: hypothetical protein ACP5NZ_02565 [Nanobdellota archaeon]